MRPYINFLIVGGLFLCINVAKAEKGDVSLDTVPNYNGWSWDALKVDNGIIQLVIIPDIGGRVMFYGFEGDKYMAVNESQIGEVYEPDKNSTGPWVSWGYGGYKCWPAPQSVWNWPPPPYLDWGNYSFTTEHASVDSVVIYMESEVESSSETKYANVVGLQQARRYSIYKNSTKIAIEEILKNDSCDRNEWSIWEVTQALPDHDGTMDYNNISVYFPGKSTSLKDLRKDGVTINSVNDSILKYNHNTNDGKIGILNTKGWSCYVDEKDEQSYAKVFDVQPGDHPDQNTSFQIYCGSGYDEIEVLSPLYDIPQGSSKSVKEYWYASHTKGAMQDINHAGSVMSKLSINNEFDVITGSYGIYNTGILKLILSNNGTELLSIDTFKISASEKYELNVAPQIPGETTRLDLLAYDYNGNLIDTLDTWLKGNNVGIEEISKNPEIEVFPTIVRSGDILEVKATENFNIQSISLYSISGIIINTEIINNTGFCRYNVPELAKGIYIISVQLNNYTANRKIIVQ